MFKKWITRFLGLKPEILLVETRPKKALDPGSKGAVVSLQAHPGFVYLLAKLAIQNDMLLAKLRSSRHDDLRSVEFLQSGLFWTAWLENQLSHEIYSTPKESIPRDPELDEIRALQETSTLSIIGEEQ